jgi:hypothetical protein
MHMAVFRYNLLTLAFSFLFFMYLTTGSRAQNLQKKCAPGAQTLLPPQLPSNVELFNPMSGLYTSLQQNPSNLDFQHLNPKYADAAPLPGSPLNEYGRLSWHSLEPNEGQYNFSVIDNVLESCPPPQGKKLCLPQGVKFGFRIEALDPQVRPNTNVTKGSDGYAVYSEVPAYLEDGKHGWLLPVNPEDKTQGHYFIPDWNDPFFLKRVEALLSVLGQRYDGDPRLGWVDIGVYGSWGEWHIAGLTDRTDYRNGRIPYDSSSPYYNLNTQAYLSNTGKLGVYQTGTLATRDFIVDAYAKAFPRTQLVMLTADGDALCHALKLPSSETHIGLRRDSLGSKGWTWQFPDQLPGCDSEADKNIILNRWKTAPFIAEPYGNGGPPPFPCKTFETDPHNGLYNIDEQVRQFHIASIRNGGICAGTWDMLSGNEQQAFLLAGLHSGYRFAPVEIDIPEFPKAPHGNRSILIHTHWTNTGVTPAYDAWNVELSLWTYDSSVAKRQEVARMTSRVDLRKVLPTGDTPVVVYDTFELRNDLVPGYYELRMQVVDPKGYMNPMQLALENETPEGYYPLGLVKIPGFGPR